MTDELLSCPFCGHPGIMEKFNGGWTVCCHEDCEATPVVASCESPEAAARKWNTRAPRSGGEVEKTLADLLKTAKLLYANAERCVIDHHGTRDAEQPGWLRDCETSIARAAAQLEGIPR